VRLTSFFANWAASSSLCALLAHALIAHGII
jgi:hypothetical protein